MTTPSQTDLFAAIDATWAPKTLHQIDGWLIREGGGGGKRVSAATSTDYIDTVSIKNAEKMMVSIDQKPLFMIRNHDKELDHLLGSLNYEIIDPVVVLLSSIDQMVSKDYSKTYDITESQSPDECSKAIWQAGGIDQARLNIMARVKGAKVILNVGDMGVAFAAASNGIAMIHAVEVSETHRRKGVANAIMHAAINWAKCQNCRWMSVLTVRENFPALQLYETLGMVEAAAYHYRIKSPG